jgi:hypothetical protein
VKTKGIHFSAEATVATVEYIRTAGTETGTESGTLSRPRLAPHSEASSDHSMTERTMNRLLMRYLGRLAGAMHEVEQPDGSKNAPVRLLATLPAGHVGDAVPRLRRGDRGRTGFTRPQAHHHHTDLRQAAT